VNKKEKQEAKLNAQSLLQSITDPINNQPDHKENDMLPIDSLVPYVNHPFKLYEGERLADMVRSIKEMGVLLPIIVRPVADSVQYEILSGHNRVNAAKEAGLIEVKAIIKSELSDDEARLIVTETNLVQRSFADLSHSERAIALKSHMDAISKQGKRNDLINEINMLLNPDKIGTNETCDPLGHKLKSRDKTADKYNLSTTNVSRYIRLSYLTRLLLDRVDNEEIAVRAAVSISYLSPDEQTALNRVLDELKYKLDMKKAESLREASENKKFTDDKIVQILSGEANKNVKIKPSASFTIKRKMYLKYFNESMNEVEVESIIDTALTEYFTKRKNT
jgi:ParB family chromosome partitioning protein